MLAICVYGVCLVLMRQVSSENVTAAAVTSVMDCASTSGLTSYAISSVLVLLYVIGLPRINAQMTHLCRTAFMSGGTALHSFEQARSVLLHVCLSMSIRLCVRMCLSQVKLIQWRRVTMLRVLR